jgi:amidase
LEGLINQTTMNRRKFIRKSAIASFGIPVIISACTGKTTPDTDLDLVDGISNDFPLLESTIADLQRMFKEGKASVRSVTELYLSRIEAVDQSGVGLNSVIELNPDALKIADMLDGEMKSGKLRGPLHGVPILIKDNIDTEDRMMNTAGSLALEGNYPERDAFIISQLRAAGAVILGKTNLSEWANFRSNQSSSGWSSRGGQTRNPYVLDRNPCGSSSGSGASVSANLCMVAIGTETNGSIICPASINGVVGIKPTVGLWSRSGIIPISATQDTAGPMARTVQDAAILLGALTGVDQADTASSGLEEKIIKDYTVYLDRGGLKGKRIGIEKSYLKKNEKVDGLLSAAIEHLKGQGAEVIEIELLDKLNGIGSDEYKVLLYEFKDGVNKYLSRARAKVHNLEDVIAFNRSHADVAMPIFTQDILEESQKLGDLNTAEYRDALKRLLDTTRNAINQVMTEFKLDAISGPSYGPSWCTDHVNGDYSTGYGFSGPAAIAGYPHITVPMGFVSGLPIGLSFFGQAFSEPKLISMAYAYEQVSLNRRPPQFERDIG